MGFLDFLRSAKQGVPSGEYQAPMYVLKRENHGFGYHIHILKLQSGNYVRTNMALTRAGNKIYAFYHNESARESISNISSNFKEQIRLLIDREVRGIPENEWRKITKDESYFMFNI